MTGLAATALLTGVVWTERLPGPTYESPQEGSPGFAGFVATFLLAVAIIALAVSFTRRMRRASQRERERAATGAPTVGTGDDVAADAATDATTTAAAAGGGLPDDPAPGAPGVADDAAPTDGAAPTDDEASTDDEAAGGRR